MTIPLEGRAALAALAICGFFDGCDSSPGTNRVARPIVYGHDDRREAYEVEDPAARAMIEGAMVALVPRALAPVSVDGFASEAPTLGAVEDLCPGVPFGQEPAVAFCTGVLVDWDLVLTAGHCVRLISIDDFVVVRGYYYDSPGHLAVSSPDDVGDVAEIVAEALDAAGSTPRLDYAWLRLKHPVRPPWRPAPVRVRPPAGVVDEPVVSIGAGGGVPLKLDEGGRIRDTHEPALDYFTADTDTAHGSSGGGAFDRSMSLVGVLARGGGDLIPTDAGCNVNAHLDDGALADEEFTYAFRAVEGLCQDAKYPSALCRVDCGDICAAEEPPSDVGCAIAAPPSEWWSVSLLASLLLRSRRGAPRTRPVPFRSPTTENAQPIDRRPS